MSKLFSLFDGMPLTVLHTKFYCLLGWTARHTAQITSQKSMDLKMLVSPYSSAVPFYAFCNYRPLCMYQRLQIAFERDSWRNSPRLLTASWYVALFHHRLFVFFWQMHSFIYYIMHSCRGLSKKGGFCTSARLPTPKMWFTPFTKILVFPIKKDKLCLLIFFLNCER